MVIIFIPVIYFYVAILAAAVLGVALATILAEWSIPLSVVLWFVLTFAALRAAKKADVSEK